MSDDFFGDQGYDYVPPPVPMDSIVEDVLGASGPVNEIVDDVLYDIAADPSAGVVGDSSGGMPSVVGDLAPVLGDVGTLGGIMGDVLDDPNAPLTDEQTNFVETETRLNGYWNFLFGGVQDGRDMQDRALDDITEGQEEKAIHDATYDVLWEINRQVNEIGSWNDLHPGEAPAAPPWPWPNY